MRSGNMGGTDRRIHEGAAEKRDRQDQQHTENDGRLESRRIAAFRGRLRAPERIYANVNNGVNKVGLVC